MNYLKKIRDIFLIFVAVRFKMSADINQEKKAESGNNDRSSSQIDDDQNEARLIGEAKVSDTAKDPEMEPQGTSYNKKLRNNLKYKLRLFLTLMQGTSKGL